MSDLERLAGSVVVTGVPGPDADADTLATLAALRPGGVVLFDRNVTTVAGTRALVTALRAAIGGDAPALACVDQEGGRVARLRFRDPGLPAMMALGAADDERLAERYGGALGADLLEVGANVDFAPVLDLALEPRGTVIGTRSLGDDPDRTSRLGAAVVRGMQATGVAATAKHFPGHGATARDSHRELPAIEVGADVLAARELRPFAAAIAAGVRAVMSAHVVVPALDGRVPATLSPRVLTRLLREELGFRGVCFTDCLQMDAIARGVGSVPGGVAALVAGADGLVVSADLALACALRDAIVAAVRAGDLPHDRLEEASRRIADLRARCAVEAASSAADDVALAVARAGIALVRGNPVLDPARPVSVVSFEGDASDGVAAGTRERPSLSAALRRRRYRSELLRVPLEPDADAVALLLDVLRAQGERSLAIVVRRAHLYDAQRAAVAALVGLARHAVVISALEPFDVPALESAATLLCTFGDEAANVEALADVLAGDAHAPGSLPVSLGSDPARRLLTEAEIDARLPGRSRARSTAADAPGDDAESGGA